MPLEWAEASVRSGGSAGWLSVASVTATQWGTAAALIGIFGMRERLFVNQYVGIAVTLLAVTGLGLLGSLITPLLVATEDPNPNALFLFLAVTWMAVNAASRLRRWTVVPMLANIGTGHKCLFASHDFSVVGAYPPGARMQVTRPTPDNYRKALDTIPLVPMPETDPVFGKDGPLIEIWRK